MLTGGCFCGAIRYEARGTPFHETSCHCSICRRTTGAPFVTWFSVRSPDFRIIQGNRRGSRQRRPCARSARGVGLHSRSSTPISLTRST
jgi:hypothetical protein